MSTLYYTAVISAAVISAAAAAPTRTPGLVNITSGKVVPGIGARFGGGAAHCRPGVDAPDCSIQPRQLIGARDFALDSTGRHLYVATYGLDDIGECPSGRSGDSCRGVRVHDNSSRLVAFDLRYPESEPVTLSYCGPWAAVEYDARRGQVVALRHVNLKTDEHGTHYAAEVVAFAANSTKPAADSNSQNCYNKPPLTSPQPGTCACAMGFDPNNLNGKVIGRRGLQKDGLNPPATMVLLNDAALVGDQNQHCVVSFPLDGSDGEMKAGEPVAGTCGKSCGSQGCASIGSPPVPAGKKLGQGRDSSLEYTMFTTPDGKLLLNDMNTETINYGKHPKAKTQFLTAPVEPKGSSLYEVPTVDPDSGNLLLLEKFSLSLQMLAPTKEGGYGNARTVLDRITGWYNDKSVYNTTVPTPIRGIPLQLIFAPLESISKGKLLGKGEKQVLALVGLAYTQGSSFLDYVFLELTL